MLNKVFTGGLFLIALTALALHFFNDGRSASVYVDTGRIYTAFTLSKELNNELEKVLKSKKHSVDSLYTAIRARALAIQSNGKSNSEDTQQIAKLEQEYMYKQQQFEKESQELSVTYNNKIWNQINQFVEDFGKKNEYTFILGANGEGSIMYGDKQADVTEAAIDYMNTRYDSKTK